MMLCGNYFHRISLVKHKIGLWVFWDDEKAHTPLFLQKVVQMKLLRVRLRLFFQSVLTALIDKGIADNGTSQRHQKVQVLENEDVLVTLSIKNRYGLNNDLATL